MLNKEIKLKHSLLIAFGFISLWLLLNYKQDSIYFFSATGIIAASLLISASNQVVLFCFLIFCLPLSINTTIPETNSDIRLPSEFLLLIACLSFTFRKFFIENYDSKILKHNVSKLLIAVLAVQIITSVTSTMPVVSIKSVIIKSLYVFVFYFAIADLILQNKTKAFNFIIWYIIGLLITVVYVLYQHHQFDFDKNYTSFMTSPFFTDHTIYSACLAFVLPLAIFFSIVSKTVFRSTLQSVFWFLVSLVLLFAIFVAASRAAWLSVIFVMLTGLLLFLRIKTGLLISIFLAFVLYSLFHIEDIKNNIKTNRYDSKKITADLEVQAKSITNITNDNSNAERINRWKCALRMAAAKPLTGYGPGTFQFQYLQFQKAEDMTPISVINPYHVRKGRGGTAHNEMLNIISESGIVAFVLFVLLLFSFVKTATKTYYHFEEKNNRYMIAALFLGWISYVTHSMFNNFLDTDKAAFLFYSSMSVIVAYHIKQNKLHE